MEPSLFRFAWRYSKRQQLIILAIILLSYPILYMTLELPKMIVNDAIQGANFPKEYGPVELSQVEYLFALCGVFLLLIVVNNAIKYVLNVYKGITGERMLRRLRYELYERVLRFRLPHFRKVSSGEIIPMVTSEVEPLGGFIGEVVALPAFQGGTLLVYIVFIAMQDPLLGAAAVALYPVQAYIIPKLQIKITKLARERVRNVRQISDKVGETITAVHEIHANDTSAWHLADIAERLYKNFLIRSEIFRRKFMMKALNNFLNALTPVFLFSIGGYLVLQGDMSMGSLLAVIAAYKDLAGPWKELLGYYQIYVDVEVKYQAVIENFDPPDLYPKKRLLEEFEGPPINGEIALAGVTYAGGLSGDALASANMKIKKGSSVVISGTDESGRPEAIQIIAGLLAPDSGKVTIDGRNLEEMPEAILGRSVSVINPSPHIFTGTVRDNLYYGLRHRPLLENPDARTPQEEERRLAEAQIAYNSAHDPLAYWEDLELAGVEDHAALDDRALEVLKSVGLGDDVFRMGLQSRIDPDKSPDLVEKILQIRQTIGDRIRQDKELGSLIDLWEKDRLNPNATLAENILFALSADPSASIDDLPKDPVVYQFFKDTDLEEQLIKTGIMITETMIQLFSDVDENNEILGAFSFITVDELPNFQKIIAKTKGDGPMKINEAEKISLIGVALKLIPARHRLGAIDEEFEKKIIAARAHFPKEAEGRYFSIDRNQYMAPQTVEDNIVFGKLRVDRRGSRERIEELMRDTISEMELRAPITAAGLEFHVGVSGSQLSNSQKQKLGIARAMLRRAPITILNGLADSNSEADIALLHAIREQRQDTTLIVGSSKTDDFEGFDAIFEIDKGKIKQTS